MYPCPCCGYEVFHEPPGSYEICPICFWEDDLVQLAFPDMPGGANECSLIEGQTNFVEFGACELRFRSNVRKPRESEKKCEGWRALEPHRDRHLKCDAPADHDLWQSRKDSKLGLYYWLPEYWLASL